MLNRKKKLSWIPMIVFISFAFGYAAEPKRFVEKNVIFSDSLPKIQIAVKGRFKYAGQFDFRIREVAEGTRFVFVDSKHSKVKRLFIAQFEGFLPHIDDYYRYSFANAMTFGGFKFRQNPYAYSNAEAREGNPNGEGVLTEDFLKKKGYSLEDELMTSRFITVAGDDKKHELILFYVENVSRTGHSLSELYEKDAPTKIWMEISDELKNRSLKSFNILE